MNVQSNVALALDGLEEGYRLIAGELNSVLSIRCPDLKVTADERKDSDSLSTARSKLRSSLPKLLLPDGMWIDTARWGLYSPWTLGYINGFENDPANVALVELCSDEVSSTIAWLKGREDWTNEQWRKWIVEPVEHHQAEWTKLLRDNGVTLFDVALILGDGDTNAARESVCRWSKSRKFQATKIGKGSRDGRSTTYDLQEVVRDVAVIEKLIPMEKQRLLDSLTRLRSGQD